MESGILISPSISASELDESEEALNTLLNEELPYLQQLGEELLKGERLDDETLASMQQSMDRAYMFSDLTLSFVEIEEFETEIEKTNRVRELAQSALKELAELKKRLENVEAIRIKRN